MEMPARDFGCRDISLVKREHSCCLPHYSFSSALLIPNQTLLIPNDDIGLDDLRFLSPFTFEIN